MTPPRSVESLVWGGSLRRKGASVLRTTSHAQGLLPSVDVGHETLVGPQKCRTKICKNPLLVAVYTRRM